MKKYIIADRTLFNVDFDNKKVESFKIDWIADRIEKIIIAEEDMILIEDCVEKIVEKGSVIIMAYEYVEKPYRKVYPTFIIPSDNEYAKFIIRKNDEDRAKSEANALKCADYGCEDMCESKCDPC